ncbi:hypothetical protein [Phyllobacterium myrsinacearum]|uniref:Pyrimidine deaminase RibD-like protein n=1 Tax=Phyllobacterium myrsinacearum TaxID=28101 RepID=A0A839EW10_9HYPH|nr:hypothetical protein [Phyllobacterium myrsinacearum]MBA8881704.1 pyrimidine deaminase RibD-like protein [Phyllobacterium myrsinacearum]
MTISPTRLVDPIHFFNARGLSVLSEDRIEHELELLQEENAKLQRKLRLAEMKLRNYERTK